MTKRPSTSQEIRQAFLDFFETKGHTIVASAPLPVHDNPTLFFTNAGMNQFVETFLGKETRAYTRATTAQKCMRIQGKHNDLENVGPSPRHHTFFEMLGNFSFGDYFKRDAIDYAWEYVTGWLGLDPARLWVTIYTEDDEAHELWQKHVPVEKILRFGKEDNFWEMGETGPCGPCSELFYYVGDMETCDPTQLNAEDDELFLEFWNLVFIQYNREADQSLTPLPAPSVDTGMGLERMVRIMQHGESNYETDLFEPAFDMVQELLGDSDEERAEKYVGYRVIADHGRAATFLIGDGVRPGNVGGDYVLRMIIRRAARFGRNIGFNEPFLGHVARAYIQKMSDVYPVLKQREELIYLTLTQEEERFARTLDIALTKLEEVLAKLDKKGETEIPGRVAFNLFATHGLPLEITRDVVQDRGYTVDEAGFQEARTAHAEASGAGAFKAYETDANVYGQLRDDLISSGQLGAEGVEYDPYGGHSRFSEVVGLVHNGAVVEQVTIGNKVELVSASTPFYVEAGGEVSDTGTITTDSGTLRVDDTQRPVPGLVIHIGEVAEGTIRTGEEATLSVDNARRSGIRGNHTATHILHHELRKHLGNHVLQAGSLVAPDRLRFDFTHDKAVKPKVLAKIEADINEAILQNYPVGIEYMGQNEAIESGAMALFGEKYGDIVRTVQIGEGGNYSFELCGGLHVAETSDIGPFRFTGESAVAAGVRRVEAVTGRVAQTLIADRLNLLDRISRKLNTPVGELEARIEGLMAEQKALQKELAFVRRQGLMGQFDSLMVNMQKVGDTNVLTAVIEGADSDNLRQMMDRFRDRAKSGVAVLGTVQKERPVLMVAVTDDLIKRGLKAGDLVWTLAKMVGGGGGGRPHMAQAGGRDASKLPEAIAAVPGLVEEALS